MTIDLVVLIPIFFIIALFYSSAGFGGGSSYLAVLALSTLPFAEFRMIALLCNIAVVSGSAIVFYKAGYVRIKRIWPLILLSVPLAYIGGRMRISEEVFFLMLGFTLFIAGLLMLTPKELDYKKLPRASNGIIGGGIGFLSGVVGIGGGIFLSPVLYLTRWAEPKIIAATTALFILINSLAGLVGQIVTNGFTVDLGLALTLIVVVVIGGQIGARYSANRFNPATVKKIAAILIILVAVRLLIKYIPLVLA